MENNQNPYIIENANARLGVYAALWMIFGVISLTGFIIAFAMLLASLSGDDFPVIVLVLNLLLGIGFAYPAIRSIKKMAYVKVAQNISEVIVTEQNPIIKVDDLQAKLSERMSARYGSNTSTLYANRTNMIREINGAVKYGFLRNCTLEFHDGVPVIAMHKKVVKDKCPHCGAPIVGVYSDTYVCSYCGRSINDVLKKK